MAVNYFFVFLMIAIVVGMFAYNTSKDILVIPFLLVGLFTLLRLWKTLLWDTVYGESSVLYAALPVSSAAFTFCKIFTAGLSLALLLTFLAPAFILPALKMSNDLYRSAEWINQVNTWILIWRDEYGMTPAGIGRVIAATWIPSFAAAGLAQVVISLIRKLRV